MVTNRLLPSYLLAILVHLGNGLAISFLSVYLHTINISFTNIGMIYAVGAVLGGFVHIPLGNWLDRHGRKAMLLCGLLGYGAYAFGLALATSTVHFIFLGIILELVGAIFWTALYAHMFDLMSYDHVGEQLGKRNAILFAIGAFAPFIAGFLITKIGYINLFYLSALICLAGLPIVFFAITDAKVKKTKDNLLEEYQKLSNVKGFNAILALLFVHTLIWGVWYIYMPVYLASQGMTTSMIGLIIFSYWMVSAATQYHMGKLMDRVPAKWIIVPALLFVWVGGVLFTRISGFMSALVNRSIMSFGFDASWWPAITELSRILPRQFHGAGFALQAGAAAIAFAVASVLGGIFADLFGILPVLIFASWLALIVALVVWPTKQFEEILNHHKHKMHLEAHKHIHGLKTHGRR